MLARRANVGLTLVSVDIGAQVAVTVHVPGVVNVVYDGLSRGKKLQEVGLDPTKGIWFDTHHPIHQYISLCDPDLPLQTYDEHVALSAQLCSLLASPSF